MARDFDNAAELRKRTQRGKRPALSADHPVVRRALAVARVSVYCQELRPFGIKVVKAIEHGERVGTLQEPPRLPDALGDLPKVGPVAALEGLGGWAQLDDVARTVHAAAHDYGLRSAQFRNAAVNFLHFWRILVDGKVISHDPGKREPDPLRRAFVISLVLWLPEYRLGPAQLGLLATVVGLDRKVVAHEGDTVSSAVVRRGERYRDLWSVAKDAGRIFRRNYLVLPGEPLLGGRRNETRLNPPFFQLPTGEVVAKRPRGIPQRATIYVRRRRGRLAGEAAADPTRVELAAIWRWGGRKKEMSLGAARVSPTESGARHLP